MENTDERNKRKKDGVNVQGERAFILSHVKVDHVKSFNVDDGMVKTVWCLIIISIAITYS